MSNSISTFLEDRDKLLQKVTLDFDNALSKHMEDLPAELKNYDALSQAGLNKQKITKLLLKSRDSKNVQSSDIASIEHTLIIQAANAVVQCLKHGGLILGLDLDTQLRAINFSGKLGIKARISRQLPGVLIKHSEQIWSNLQGSDQEHRSIYLLDGSIFLYQKVHVSWGGGYYDVIPISKHRASDITSLPL